MFIWSTFKLRLAITFILNAVNPGSKCTKEVTSLEKLTVGWLVFTGQFVIVLRAALPSFSLWFAGCYYFFSVRDSLRLKNQL